MTFSLWYVGSGERVFAGEPVAEVLIPGACCQVLAPADGEMVDLVVQFGERLSIGDILGYQILDRA